VVRSPPRSVYTWDDYRRVLIHLQETTGPATLVANVLKEPPSRRSTGRPPGSPRFLAESGICWMWLVHLDLEPEFSVALERATDSVVRLVAGPSTSSSPS